MRVLQASKRVSLTLINSCRSKWVEIGKSEVVKDSLNPRFIKGFQVEYRFEERQKFKVAVYDVDDFTDPNNLEAHDFIGEYEFLLHEVVTARNQQLKKPLVNAKEKGRNNGTIILTAEEDVKNNSAEAVSFEMRANLPGQDSQSVFFILSRYVGPQQWIPVYKSEDKAYDAVIKAHRWNTVKILTSILCKEEPGRDIRVDFYAYSSSGNHKFLGANQTITLDKIK